MKTIQFFSFANATQLASRHRSHHRSLLKTTTTPRAIPDRNQGEKIRARSAYRGLPKYIPPLAFNLNPRPPPSPDYNVKAQTAFGQ